MDGSPPSFITSSSSTSTSPRSHRERGRTAGAVVATIGLHTVVAVLIVLAFTHRDAARRSHVDTSPLAWIYLPQSGDGGGGGGSPAPVPPRAVVIARSAPPVVDPLTPTVEPPQAVTPVAAPVMTVSHDLSQATGVSSVSLSDLGGGGIGGGLGPGNGHGVGPGFDRGFGGQYYRPGAGVREPTVMQAFQPAYTSAAMGARIQGRVRLEAVVDENGHVTNLRVTRSLDTLYGLDQQAMKAAALWLFHPARDRNNRPVPVVIEFELEFLLH
jgi:protein TonB